MGESLLALPKQAAPLSEADRYERIEWTDKYAQRRKEAAGANKPIPIEFPPSAPYIDWANHLSSRWRGKLDAFAGLSGITEEQKGQASERFQQRKQQLADYLADAAEEMEEYQHDLWRLEQKEAQAGATDIPYRAQRILEKHAKTSRLPWKWVSEVQAIQQNLVNDFQRIAAEGDPSASEAAKSVLTSPKEKRLHWMDLGVTGMIIGVGICLLLGFFTRLASSVGALFLLSVIATQPPWIAGATPTINQTVECAALLLLAATGAGRWAGLDFFTQAFCQKFCGSKR